MVGIHRLIGPLYTFVLLFHLNHNFLLLYFALAIRCMDFCHALTSQGLAFSFSLSLVSNFSFSLDTRKMALDTENETTPKKRKSPSTIRRNARRREEFRLKKQNPAAPESSARPLRHLPSPTAPSGRRQVTTVGRNPSVPSFSQLDGTPSPSPSPATPVPPPPSTTSTNIIMISTLPPTTALHPLWWSPTASMKVLSTMLLKVICLQVMLFQLDTARSVLVRPSGHQHGSWKNRSALSSGSIATNALASAQTA